MDAMRRGLGHCEELMEREFQIYREAYALPTKHAVIPCPRQFVDHIQNRRYFVILFLRTIDHCVFVIPEVIPGDHDADFLEEVANGALVGKKRENNPELTPSQCRYRLPS